LGVSSKVSLIAKVVELDLTGGELYNIELNGVVTQTQASKISLNLKEGTNILKVSTDLPCQGVYEERFLFSKEPLVYPNPFDNFIQVFFGRELERVRVRILNPNGRIVKNTVYAVNQTELELDLSALSSGLYFIQFEADDFKGTTKVIKR